MRKSGYTGIARTASGRLRRVEPSDPTSPTLKRSFETEETEASALPQARRTVPPRTAKPGLQPSGSSRRAELSIDLSSKTVDGSAGSVASRFGLRRPETSGVTRGTDQANRRADPVSHSASQRRAETPSPVESPRKLPDIPLAKGPELTGTSRIENSSPTLSEPKTQSPIPEAFARSPDRSEVVPSHIASTMSEPVKPAPSPASMEKPSVDFSYVGIDAILEQMRRKAMKQGFELNIMVVGQSGLGKSTLMNTLFKSKVSRRTGLGSADERIPKTVEIKSISHEIEEKGVRMKLTVIDTPGFGDHINNENCWQPIMRFINEQYEQYLQEEININRKTRIPDSRVHCCIYFIPPTGHSLRPLDVEFMRRLSKVVNIVPVIAKADTLTLEERDFFKNKIREELQANDIDVYPQKEFDEDAEDRAINERIRGMVPFAVVGSDQECQVNGRRLLGRKTKWGTIEVENIAHCEFAYLRDLLIRSHMQNIKDITSSIHYEGYRVRRLNECNAQTNGFDEQDVTSHEL
ncbi:neuronal-specific septin-3-like isoform X1 [Paramormyrops kingsleyae]|uniref:neuronal-specific septin-3-like isoform X1 n=2 Tax=Paramormyrops kingsleyae TaxID=1676925 RepID=UPI000CD62908|nr:neuronal-specific septin-3-like isoform X1 [Paramormyrops kingsleyae]